jgi:hypothetical protein
MPLNAGLSRAVADHGCRPRERRPDRKRIRVHQLLQLL